MKWLVAAFFAGLVCLFYALIQGVAWTWGGYSGSQWLLLVGLLAWSPVTVWVIRKVLVITFRLRRQFIDIPVTEASAKSVRRAASLLGASAIWVLFIPVEQLPHAWVISNGLHFTLIASSVWLVVSAWEGFCDVLTVQNVDRRAEKLLIPVTRKLVRAVILVSGFLILLGAYSVDWKGVVAGLGIGGLVVALAAKDSVENIFGSLTILFDMPFAIGDWVKVGTVDGVVEEINLRSTRIRTPEDSVITLPNSNLIKASVENMGARRVRRQKFLVRFSYETTAEILEFVTQDLLVYLETLPGVERGRSIVQMNDMAEFSFGVLVQCYFENMDLQAEMSLRGEVMRRILQLAEKHNAAFFNGERRLPATTPTA